MAIKNKHNLRVLEADTAAEIANTVFASNELVTALDTGEVKKGNGADSFDDLDTLNGNELDINAITELIGYPEELEAGESEIVKLWSAKDIYSEIARQCSLKKDIDPVSATETKIEEVTVNDEVVDLLVIAEANTGEQAPPYDIDKVITEPIVDEAKATKAKATKSK